MIPYLSVALIGTALAALPMPERPRGIVVSHSMPANVRRKNNPTRVWEMQKKARRMVARACGYSFLECKRDPHHPDRFLYKGGTFGQGTLATLTNDPLLGIAVFKNCGNLKSSPIETVLDCKAEDIVTDRHIEVFVKAMLEEDVSRNERYAQDKRIAPIQKEPRRSRGMARRGFGAFILDIFDRDTGELLPALENLIVMEQITGTDLSEFPAILHASQVLTTRRYVGLMLQLYDYVSENPTDREAKSEFLSACKLASEENWRRMAWLLGLDDTGTAFINLLWGQNLRHCDVHQTNIRYKEHHVQTWEELEDGLKAGHFAPLDPGVVSWARPLADEAIPELGDASSVRLIRFHPDEVRLIDLAFALDLTLVVKNRNYDLASIHTPCRNYRSIRDDDSASVTSWYFWTQRTGSGDMGRRVTVENALERSAAPPELKEAMLADTTSVIGRAFQRYRASMTEMFDLWSSWYNGTMVHAPHAKHCYELKEKFWHLLNDKQI
eukprot:Polyplicarium_translucidae@DN4537_c0_g1_i1.p1